MSILSQMGIDDDGLSSDSSSPIITFVPVVRTVDMSYIAGLPQYAIQVGCVKDDIHYGATGTTLDYFALFEMLQADGYDPLSPLRGSKARQNIGQEITAQIIRGGKRKSRQALDIRSRLNSIGRKLCDFARDYIYGALTVPSFSGDGGSLVKQPLARETIRKREVLSDKGKASYDGEAGIDEPLMETGALRKAIKYRLVRIADIGQAYIDKMSKSVAKARKKMRGRALSAKETRAVLSRKSKEEQLADAAAKRTANLQREIADVKRGKALSASAIKEREKRFSQYYDRYRAALTFMREGVRVINGRKQYFDPADKPAVLQMLRQIETEVRRLGYSEDDIKEFRE